MVVSGPVAGHEAHGAGLSPPARDRQEVNMGIFEDDMAPSAASASSVVKRDRESPARLPLHGPKVRKVWHRHPAFCKIMVALGGGSFRQRFMQNQLLPPGFLPVVRIL